MKIRNGRFADVLTLMRRLVITPLFSLVLQCKINI